MVYKPHSDSIPGLDRSNNSIIGFLNTPSMVNCHLGIFESCNLITPCGKFKTELMVLVQSGDLLSRLEKFISKHKD